MHLFIKKVFISFAMCFCCCCSFSQGTVSGNVSGPDKQPQEHASVVLHKGGNPAVLAFAITDANGDFTIDFSFEDNLQLTVSVIGFEKQTVNITAGQKRLQFFLKHADHLLPVVTVKSANTVIHGDTITYSAKDYTQKQDLVAGDLLKKIPGIEVSSDGTVKYNGRPIVNYYIEGLDLLEDRYGIANNNLPVSAIDKIQVLENHQPVKALNGIVFSDRAAVNIKLKDSAKVRMFGSAKIGAGAAPFLFDANIAAMLFRKQLQFINTYKQNNIGTNNAAELTAHNFQDNPDAIENLAIKFDLLALVKPAAPSLPQKRYLFNDAHTLSVNGLKAMKHDAQLRFNIDFINDKQKQDLRSETKFFLPGDSVIAYNETYKGIHHVNMLQGSASLFKNIPSLYYKNTVRFQGWWERESNTLFTPKENTQQLKNPFFAVSNSFDLLVNKNKKVKTFSSYTGYTSMPQQLNISPGLYEDFLNAGVPYNYLRQKAALQTFYTNNSVSFKNANRKIIADYKAGFNVQYQHFATELFKESNPVAADSLYNNLDWFKLRVYEESNFTYVKNRFRITCSLPAAYNMISYKNRINNAKENAAYLIVTPKIDVVYKIASLWSLGVSAEKNNNLGDVSNIAPGYILNNYRSLTQNPAELINSRSVNYDLEISYKDPLKSRAMSVRIFTMPAVSNMLYTQKFVSGAELSNAVIMKNRQQSTGITFRGNQYFSSIKTSAGIGMSLSSVEKPLLVYDKLLRYYNRSFMLNSNIITNLFSFLSADYTFSLRMASLKMKAGAAAAPIKNTMLTQSCSFNFFLSKKMQLDLAMEDYLLKDQSGDHRNTIFGDVSLKYKTVKRKVEYEAKCQNVFNTQYYKTASFDENSQYVSYYKLRPRQVVVNVLFNFK